MLLQMDQLQLCGCTFEIWGSFNNGHIHVLHLRYLEQMWHFSLLLILATPLLTANVNPSPSWEVRYDHWPSLMHGIFLKPSKPSLIKKILKIWPSLMPGICFKTKPDKKKDVLFLGETWAGRQMGRRHLGLFRLKPKQATPITYHLPNKAGRILEIISGVLISPMWVVTAGISWTIFQPICMDN